MPFLSSLFLSTLAYPMSHSDGYARLLDELRDAESAIERSIVRGAGKGHAEAAQKRASAWYTERRDDVPQGWYHTLNEEQQNELLSDVQDVVSYYERFDSRLNTELVRAAARLNIQCGLLIRSLAAGVSSRGRAAPPLLELVPPHGGERATET